MKKSRINLLLTKENYQKYEEYFKYLKIGFFILIFLYFIIFFYFLINLKIKSDQENYLNLKKNSLLNLLQGKIDDEAKINLITKKYQALENFLKDDAFSSYYYKILKSSLNQSSQSAILKTFDIDKQRNVNFSVIFYDFADLKRFFQYFEDKNFTKNFEQLTLKNFNIIGALDNQQENYQLDFKGKFYPLEKINYDKN